MKSETALIARDLGIKGILGKKPATNVRGDVMVMNKNGSATYIEVVSEGSQTVSEMKIKVKTISQDLTNSGIKTKVEFQVFEPQVVFDKYPDIAAKYLNKLNKK